MIQQQDPVGLLTFDEDSQQPGPEVARGQRDVLSLLANLKPEGKTDVAASLNQVAAMLRHASLVMIFSDLLADPEPILQSLYRLRHGGHDVILFHVLDEAETNFPFGGMVDLEDPETSQRLQIDADAFRRDYLDQVEAFRKTYQRGAQSGVDTPLDRSMPFDRYRVPGEEESTMKKVQKEGSGSGFRVQRGFRVRGWVQLALTRSQALAGTRSESSGEGFGVRGSVFASNSFPSFGLGTRSGEFMVSLASLS